MNQGRGNTKLPRGRARALSVSQQPSSGLHTSLCTKLTSSDVSSNGKASSSNKTTSEDEMTKSTTHNNNNNNNTICDDGQSSLSSPWWLRPASSTKSKDIPVPTFVKNDVVYSTSKTSIDKKSNQEDAVPTSSIKSTPHTTSLRMSATKKIAPGVPPCYRKSSAKLPQVSSNLSKNDMSVNNCVKYNEFENEYLTAQALEGACSWIKDWEDLINFRRACTLFASVGAIELKKRFVYRITKRFVLWFWMTFQDYTPEELLATRFHLDPKWIIGAPIDMNAPDSTSKDTDQLMLNILRKIGHHLTTLRMDDFIINGGLDTIRNFLFEYAPHMTELVLNLPHYSSPNGLIKEIDENGGALYDDKIFHDFIPKLKQVPEQMSYKPRFRLTTFHYRARPDTWFPLQWLELFRGYPNLQDFRIADVTVIEMIEIVNALISNDLPQPLPLKKLNVFYTQAPSTPSMRQLYEEYTVVELLPLYMTLPFHLTHLDICIQSCLELTDVNHFLSKASFYTLESLTLTRILGTDKISRKFDPIFNQVYFPNLIHFETSSDMFSSFEFLNSMPNLKKMVMNGKDPNDIERVGAADSIWKLFANVFSNSNSDFNRGENLEDIHFSPVDFPVYEQQCQLDKENEDEFNGSVDGLSNITLSNDCKYSASFPKSKFDLALGFPTLYILKICSINNEQLRAIFYKLSKLRCLTLFGPNLKITDEGIIGVSNSKIERFISGYHNGQVKREFPYVGNLKFLRSFIVESFPGQIQNITSISLKFGLRDCENLNEVVLIGTNVSSNDSRDWASSLPITSFRLNREWN